MNKIKTAIVGYGMSAEVFHTPLLYNHAGFEIVAFLERSKSRSQEVLPNTTLHRDYGDLLGNQEIDLIVITTPNELHFEQAAKALKAGKHVVIEKPLCVTIAQFDELKQLSKEYDKCLITFHNRRWDADFLWLQGLVNAGVKIYEIDSRFDRFRNYIKGWKELDGFGNGILYDLGSHLIDQFYNLYDQDDIKLIYSDLQSQREVAENVDYFELHFKINNGPKIITKAGMCCSHSFRLKVDTENGTYMISNVDQQEGLLKKYGIDYNDNLQGETIIKHYKSADECAELRIENGSYSLFYDGVYKAINNNQISPVELESVRPAIELLEKLSSTLI